MSDTYTSLLVHLVWSTKGRLSLIQKPWQIRLYRYIAGILDKKKCCLITAGGVADHVHLLVSMHQQVDVSELVNAIKSNSSRWIRTEFHPRDGFAWQNGYGAFSLSITHKKALCQYIANQEEHHKARSSLAEYKFLLRKHEVEFEPSMLD